MSIPDDVRAELASTRAPSAIQEWIGDPPAWLFVEADEALHARLAGAVSGASGT